MSTTLKRTNSLVPEEEPVQSKKPRLDGSDTGATAPGAEKNTVSDSPRKSECKSGPHGAAKGEKEKGAPFAVNTTNQRQAESGEPTSNAERIKRCQGAIEYSDAMAKLASIVEPIAAKDWERLKKGVTIKYGGHDGKKSTYFFNVEIAGCDIVLNLKAKKFEFIDDVEGTGTLIVDSVVRSFYQELVVYWMES